MLISRKHRFIFIHIYKNAGTSITQALLPFAADKWQLYADRFAKRVNVALPFSPRPFPIHITASELIDEIGQEAYDPYFSFAFVRNPWDWQVSLYSYIVKFSRHRLHKHIVSLGSFKNYIRWRCDPESQMQEAWSTDDLFRLQKDFLYSSDGYLLVDFVGRFENLYTDFESITERLAISAQLKKFNVSNSTPYQDFYDHETRELVRHAFQPDIECFNYDFDSITRKGS